MPIRGSPNGAGYLRPQAGRDRPESVVAINRNGWSQSIGMAGRDRPVRALCIVLRRGIMAQTPRYLQIHPCNSQHANRQGAWN
jgi:hypothetical protein